MHQKHRILLKGIIVVGRGIVDAALSGVVEDVRLDCSSVNNSVDGWVEAGVDVDCLGCFEFGD